MINVQNIERHLTLNTINDSRVDIHKHTQTNSRTFAHISVSQHSHTQQTRQCPVAGFQARDVFVSCKPASGNVNMFSFNLISINVFICQCSSYFLFHLLNQGHAFFQYNVHLFYPHAVSSPWVYCWPRINTFY